VQYYISYIKSDQDGSFRFCGDVAYVELGIGPDELNTLTELLREQYPESDVTILSWQKLRSAVSPKANAPEPIMNAAMEASKEVERQPTPDAK
jgi:hypothetical protein